MTAARPPELLRRKPVFGGRRPRPARFQSPDPRPDGAFYDGVTVMTVQEDWDATFAKLGRSAPAQRADELTTDYQRRLARVGRKYIPAAEEIARVRFDYTMPDGVVPKFSEMMRAAVERNLYRTDNMEPGEMRPVLETDPNTGAKIRSWIGPTSFVKDMGLPCRRVVRINAPSSTPLYAADRRSMGQLL
jgi:hypothetical protein